VSPADWQIHVAKNWGAIRGAGGSTCTAVISGLEEVDGEHPVANRVNSAMAFRGNRGWTTVGPCEEDAQTGLVFGCRSCVYYDTCRSYGPNTAPHTVIAGVEADKARQTAAAEADDCLSTCH
jgi:hypothetical protein